MTRLLALALFLPVAAWGQNLINEPYMDERGMLIVPDGPSRGWGESPTTLTIGGVNPAKAAPATVTCYAHTPIRIQDEKGNVLFKIECP